MCNEQNHDWHKSPSWSGIEFLFEWATSQLICPLMCSHEELLFRSGYYCNRLCPCQHGYWRSKPGERGKRVFWGAETQKRRRRRRKVLGIQTTSGQNPINNQIMTFWQMYECTKLQMPSWLHQPNMSTSKWFTELDPPGPVSSLYD